MALLTIEQLVAKKEALKPVQAKRVHVDKLGGEIELRRLPVLDYWNLISKVREDDLEGLLRAEIELVYAFCPVLHSQPIQEAYGGDVPTDAVLPFFGEDLGALGQVVAAISTLYGDAETEVKN